MERPLEEPAAAAAPISERHCHVWTALADQGLFFGTARVVGAVMSSAFLRGEWSPLALMLSADPLP
jgi:hypothetical protein